MNETIDEEIIEEEKEEKKKLGKIGTLTIFLIFAICIILLLRFSGFYDILNDNSLSNSDRIWVIAGVIGTIIFLAVFAKMPKRFRIYAVAWVKCFFIYFIWPMMFIIIILLGAIEQKYPPNYEQCGSGTEQCTELTGNYSGPFNETLNKSLNIAGGTVIKVADRVIISIYDLGKNHPDFWIFLTIMFIIISLVAMRGIVRDEIENMRHKEIIENAIKKYEEDVKQDKETIWNKNRSSWLLLGLIILTAIIGLWLWFK